ncbi:DEAD/DEAH box helicase [Pelagibacterium xiamenense]|uniref:DEAD/DEAH box helicase n=1 Tax=Pelagibacterium xiamenense TaxID=2901140 RepID=UPI001E3601C6|nr:DEAD/DEAH box helicase [Pelagibacterium xiamenense]MCD7060865.1 DEAD/DEAH box helicase [Pelagibacterium xiamenense]
MTEFLSLGLNPALVKALDTLGFDTPTPIQAEAIPHVLAGRDIMGLAQTGTGKTAAFGLPLVHHLLALSGKPAPRTIKSLILAPTRELVNQIAINLRGFAKGTPIKVNCVVGGMSIHAQVKALAHGSDILVATPGRLLDLVKRQAVRLDSAKFLVLDEADQMLDLGFIHALREISRLVGQPRQTLLFSATMPKQMTEIASTYLTDPIRIEVAAPGKAADKITQSVHYVDAKAKPDLLASLIGQAPDSLSLVFTRTKHGAEKLMKGLAGAGFAVGSIHGNKSQGQRDRTLKAFRNGNIRVLVATDVAARGIDIPGVSHVYNYELPEVAENYVHRIGRTARAGAEGEAVALCAPAEFALLRGVEKLMGITVTTAGGERPERAPRFERPGGGKKQRPRGKSGQGKPAQAKRPDGQKAAPARHRKTKARRARYAA